MLLLLGGGGGGFLRGDAGEQHLFMFNELSYLRLGFRIYIFPLYVFLFLVVDKLS